MERILELLVGAVSNLTAYLAAHVILCLIPAFFIAGAMTALIPKASITRWLGRAAPMYVSYPAAAVAGSLLAVCSCTVVPLFAGIYKKGAGIGPAVTFLFFAPAGNIMALAYTGSILGGEFAMARLMLCLIFGIGIGLLMNLFFRRDEIRREMAPSDLFSEKAKIAPASIGLLLSLFFLLLSGTLKIRPLTQILSSFNAPLPMAEALQNTLQNALPFDASKGEEGVSAQGLFLIVLLFLIGWSAWQGIEKMENTFSPWTWISVAIINLTLLLASVNIAPFPGGIHILFPGRFLAVLLCLILVFSFAKKLSPDDRGTWLWESWRFVKKIFPLLLIGVFFVGILRQLIRPEWIQALTATNTLSANSIAVIFGVFMYFPTLVEVPIARMFLDLGMHRGPLLAYLMADPELSLQSILMVSSVLGRSKTFSYVALVAIFSVISGMVYGSWIDGTNWLQLALSISILMGTFLAIMIYLHKKGISQTSN